MASLLDDDPVDRNDQFGHDQLLAFFHLFVCAKCGGIQGFWGEAGVQFRPQLVALAYLGLDGCHADVVSLPRWLAAATSRLTFSSGERVRSTAPAVRALPPCRTDHPSTAGTYPVLAPRTHALPTRHLPFHSRGPGDQVATAQAGNFFRGSSGPDLFVRNPGMVRVICSCVLRADGSSANHPCGPGSGDCR